MTTESKWTQDKTKFILKLTGEEEKERRARGGASDGRGEDDGASVIEATISNASRGKRRARKLWSCGRSGAASGGRTTAKRDGGWRSSGDDGNERKKKKNDGHSGLFIEREGR